MDKVEYRQVFKQLYAAKSEPMVLDVPPLNYLMIDGSGDPNTSPEYIDAIQTLYPIAYTLKFMSKQAGQDFGVMPLEGLWWAEDIQDFSAANKANWQWTAMIMQPDLITAALFEQAKQLVAAKKQPPSLDKLRFERYQEGRVAQLLYIGPYADEGPTIQILHAFITAQGGVVEDTNKHHHEIYLSDPRRTAPSKLKTIIRQPF